MSPASAISEESRTAPTVPGWRLRLLDQLCGTGAIVIGGLVIFGSGSFTFGESRLADAMVVASPVAMLVAAMWRRAPYRVRAVTFLASLFCLEFLAASQYGYVVGTVLLALFALGLSGLLLGPRWAVAGWGVSTGILIAAALLIHAGWLSTSFEPARVDPRNLDVAIRYSVTYGALSALLALGVYLVVDRLSSSLAETRRALAQVTSARTERARAEIDKRAAEAQFRSVVEHAPDSIAIVDRDHRVTFANHQTLAPDLPSPIGRLAEDLVTPDFADRVREGIDQVFRTGEPVAYDIQVPVEGRGIVWYASRVGPIVEDGSVDRVIVVTTDISERMELEGQVLQAQKLEAIGQLTGGVAHDFNNLLTVILGNLQLVSSGLSDADPSRAFVENARVAARRGSALTHRLLAFGRKQALQPRVVDLGALVAGMDDLLGRSLGETVTVHTASDPDLWKCEIDPTQLENVVLNLAINARDAMPLGGAITIETSNASVGEDAEALAPGEYVRLELTDSGTGMPREVLAQAFEPFFTTKGPGRGSGLGLSMVYGFIKQSGGHVDIESEPGRGTCVRVYLPRSRAVETSEATRDDPSEAVVSAQSPRGRGELVLVVEDDEDVRSLTVNLLERAGYKTVEAADGAAALSQLDREPEVAPVFTDVVLPGEMSGPELARRIRASRPGLPLLFTSGYLEDAVDLRLSAEFDLVEKPFTPEVLAKRIHAALRAGREQGSPGC